ncbi:hypothetical protein VPNG_06960 [Cytospora leucostoma]|uniref:Myb-like domain-containing protein n=1 Tax=Cytospora leucostoma TaxID=1230097 RepID=A0A423WXC7_9PEZI|nr:hypothetical protein VPNG_06960 [Cytospora leucostoma]
MMMTGLGYEEEFGLPHDWWIYLQIFAYERDPCVFDLVAFFFAKELEIALWYYHVSPTAAHHAAVVAAAEWFRLLTDPIPASVFDPVDPGSPPAPASVPVPASPAAAAAAAATATATATIAGTDDTPAAASHQPAALSQDQAPRGDRRWTDEEDTELRRLREAGKSYKEIALTLDRNEKACETRGSKLRVYKHGREPVRKNNRKK